MTTSTTPTPGGYQNPLSTLMSDPVRNFKFLVTFTPNDLTNWGALSGGFGTMGFVSLTGLSVSTESIAYREGGYNTNVHQIPGQSSFTPLTLSKGVLMGNDGNALWMKRLFSVMTPTAVAGYGIDFRCTIDIQVLSHPNPLAATGSDSSTTVANGVDQHTALRFRVYNAWITSLAYSNLDAGGNTLMVEDMTIVHEGFDVSYATGLAASLGAPKFTSSGATSSTVSGGGGKGPIIA